MNKNIGSIRYNKDISAYIPGREEASVEVVSRAVLQGRKCWKSPLFR